MMSYIQMGLKRCLLGHPQRMLRSMSNIFHRNQSDGNETNWKLPTRKQQLKSLQKEDFDVLVIGGGAVGCGCALEAASRGLKTALIEAGDFGSGASSKSSKLVEGGSSYLQAAIQGADLQQIYMLQQLLTERATMLRIAPHLNRVQPMLMPIYSPLRLPFYWLGLKLYDAMAGMANVHASHFLSQEKTLNEFPLLRRHGLLGSLVYYDGQMDDARMCLALALTAAKNDATIANYVKLQKLLPAHDQNGSRRAVVEDTLSKDTFSINSRCLINTTGAGTDVIRKLDDCKVSSIARPKMGTHISLPGHFGSSQCGLLFPSKQLDEKTMFMFPFENRLLVGSVFAEPEKNCCLSTAPKCEEVDCLLSETREVLDECALLCPHHVLSAWTGVMPSVVCPGPNPNEDSPVVPHFLLEVSDNQLITLAGGRWSSYRVMASDAIDAAIEHCCLEPQVEVSSTQSLLLDGAEDYYCMLPLDLVQNYDLPMDVAEHLAESYGCNAFEVLLKTTQCQRQRLHPNFPYIRAEVDYACQREYACHLVDVIARRLRVAFVDASAAYQMLPTVLEIMSKHLCWDEHAQIQQLQSAKEFLKQQMGLGSIVKYNKLLPEKRKSTKEKDKEEPLQKGTFNSYEYRRLLAKSTTNADLRCKKKKDPLIRTITTTDKTKQDKINSNSDVSERNQKDNPLLNEMKAKSTVKAEQEKISEITTSLPSYQKDISQSIAYNRTVYPRPTEPKRSVLCGKWANSMRKMVQPINIDNHLNKNTGNIKKQEPTKLGLNSLAAQINSVRDNAVPVTKQGDPSVRNPNSNTSVKKGIAKHFITAAEVIRKVNQQGQTESAKTESDKSHILSSPKRNLTSKTYLAPVEKNKSEPKEILPSNSRRYNEEAVNELTDGFIDTANKATEQNIINSTRLTFSRPSCSNNHPKNIPVSKKNNEELLSNAKSTLQENTEAQLPKERFLERKSKLTSLRNSANITERVNKSNALAHDSKGDTSDILDLETPNLILTSKNLEHPEEQSSKEKQIVGESDALINRYTLKTSDTNSRTTPSVHSHKMNTSERKRLEMLFTKAKPTTLRKPSDSQLSLGKFFITKIKYPTTTTSTLNNKYNGVERSSNRSNSAQDQKRIHIDQKSPFIRKTSAMRLQSLLFKDKHFESQGEYPKTKDPSRIQETSIRGSPSIHYRNGHPIEKRSTEIPSFTAKTTIKPNLPKSRHFHKESQDSNSSKTMNSFDEDPKLR